jgi:phenylalanyl-tRNA synthetase beta chain
MLISYNWLSDYLSTQVDINVLTDTLTSIGLEVEGCEERQAVKGGLQGVVIGEVMTREQHPDADRLSVTTVNVGTGEPLQIVCGAPNVAAGQKVAVAMLGATLYPSEGEPMTMKKSKIRGIESQGMICAEDELGLGSSHAGIMVLDADAPVGQAAAEYFDLKSDFIIEIGLTPNRSDAQSHLGVAQDVAAALTARGEQVVAKTPENKTFEMPKTAFPITVKVENEALCRRFAGLVLTDITVAESPKWLQERLLAIDVRPINNVVDCTNYVLHELGQPLHAYDYTTIAAATISVKTLPQGTKFMTLDNNEIELNEADLMVCDSQNSPMCMAGVYGGAKTGVSESTKTIFLEAAYFDATSLRRSSTRHNLRTAAARTFEKGIDPNGCAIALQRAANLIMELSGAKIASEVIDIYTHKIEKAQVLVRFAQINRLIGNDLSIETVKNILKALNILVLKENTTDLLVEIPTNKPDVTRECDVIEEIIRIYGLDNIKIDSIVRSTLTFAEKPDAYALRNTVANQLAAQGLVEMMGMSITQSRYCEMMNIPAENLIFIHNTANKGLDVLRPTMVFSALEAVVRNQNRQNPDLALFEFGKIYLKKNIPFVTEKNAVTENNAVIETNKLSLTVTGQRTAESWLNKEKSAASYYTIKAQVEGVLQRVGALEGLQMTALADDNRFVYGLKLHRGEQIVAEFGRLHTALCKKMEIKNEVFYAEINWESVLKITKKHKVKFTELSKFPTVRRDLALVLDKNVNYQNIELIAKKEAKKLLQAVNLFDIYENEQHVGAGKKSCSVSFLFLDTEKTLNEKDIEGTMQRLIAAYEKQLGAVIRK